MNNVSTSAKWGGVLVGTLPVLAILIVRIGVPDAGPSTSKAADALGMSQAPARYTPPTASDEEVAYRERCESLRGGSAMSSPFFIPVVEEDDLPEAPVLIEHEPDAPEPEFSVPTVEVTSILSGGRKPLAVIGGKPLSVGDELGDGWSLVKIDGKSGSVSIGHAEHGVVRVPIRRDVP